MIACTPSRSAAWMPATSVSSVGASALSSNSVESDASVVSIGRSTTCVAPSAFTRRTASTNPGFVSPSGS